MLLKKEQYYSQCKGDEVEYEKRHHHSRLGPLSNQFALAPLREKITISTLTRAPSCAQVLVKYLVHIIIIIIMVSALLKFKGQMFHFYLEEVAKEMSRA